MDFLFFLYVCLCPWMDEVRTLTAGTVSESTVNNHMPMLKRVTALCPLILICVSCYFLFFTT